MQSTSTHTGCEAFMQLVPHCTAALRWQLTRYELKYTTHTDTHANTLEDVIHSELRTTSTSDKAQIPHKYQNQGR